MLLFHNPVLPQVIERILLSQREVKLGRCSDSVSVRILLVDDNEAVSRELRSLLLLQSGWQVCGEGKNGLEAFENAGSCGPPTSLWTSPCRE